MSITPFPNDDFYPPEEFLSLRDFHMEERDVETVRIWRHLIAWSQIMQCWEHEIPVNSIVAVDCKWAHYLRHPQLSYMTVATWERVYVFQLNKVINNERDVEVIKECMGQIRKLLGNQRIVKIFYNVKESLGVISHYLRENPGDHNQVIHMNKVIDMRSVLRVYFGDKEDEEESEGGGGKTEKRDRREEEREDRKERKEYVERMFGKQMDRYQEISNWDRRELSRNQRHFAALDCYVLLEMFRKALMLMRLELYVKNETVW